jgi:hypothetical protein
MEGKSISYDLMCDDCGEKIHSIEIKFKDVFEEYLESERLGNQIISKDLCNKCLDNKIHCVIKVDVEIFTDDDYELDDYERLGFEKTSSRTYKASKVIKDSDYSSTKCEAMHYMKNVVVHIRPECEHYWILSSFIEMLEDVMSHLDNNEDEYTAFIWGNYSGTSMGYKIIIDEEEE